METANQTPTDWHRDGPLSGSHLHRPPQLRTENKGWRHTAPTAYDLRAHFVPGLPKGPSLPAIELLPGHWPPDPHRAWAAAKPEGGGGRGTARVTHKLGQD